MADYTSSRRHFIAASMTALTGMAAIGSSAWAKPVLKADVIRLGMIGTGARGTGLATLIKNMPEMELVACCDPILEHLQKGMSLATKVEHT